MPKSKIVVAVRDVEIVSAGNEKVVAGTEKVVIWYRNRERKLFYRLFTKKKYIYKMFAVMKNVVYLQCRFRASGFGNSGLAFTSTLFLFIQKF